MQSRRRSQDILMYIVTYLILHGKVGIIDADTCKASKPTQTTVNSCPQTSLELQKAKEEKDCESISTLQNCSKPEEFVYHCLPSTKKDKLYEVCAPAIYSLGYCIGYDDLNQNVQILFKDSCTASSCSKRFSSADVLKYALCQQLLRNGEKKDFTSPQSPPRGHGGTSLVCHPGHDQSTVIILICFLLFLAFTIVAGILWRKRIKNKCLQSRNRGNNDHEIGADTPFLQLDSQAGFDRKAFEKELKEYHLDNLTKIFLDNNIDCVRQFLDLEEEDFKRLNLDKNQMKKCQLAKKEIEPRYLKKKTSLKNRSKTV